MLLKVALILSILLQFSAAFIAISLIRRTRTNIAWWLISVGFLLMAIRRLLEFDQVYNVESALNDSLLNSWIAILISVIMLISLIFIKRIFNIQKRIDDLRKENESRVLSVMIKTEENERQRFAKELHDGLGPLLSSVKMSLSALARNPNGVEKEKILLNTENLIDESILSLKEISNNLSPHVLNNFGLLKAVRSFANKLQIIDEPKISINGNIEDKRFPYNIEVVLYRIICELVMNTLKHASARNINIDLVTDKKTLILMYYDDGVGFDMGSIELGTGMGYSNIQSRIKSLNGTLEIQAEEGHGVQINITVNIA
ncbi:MAG: sensor histidine kinase [Bacteroidales bacterium]|nr:sensor histidine kinase [Bacteroidales bacterium]